MLEVLFTRTVLSKHYIDPNYEVNATFDLMFRSTKNQTGTLEGFKMILWKKSQNLMQAHKKEGVVTLI